MADLRAHRHRLPATAAAVTTAVALVFSLLPGMTAHATGVIGPLRAPGEPAFIAAHRGDRASAPENTVAAFEAAVSGGSDFLEADVRRTADGRAVVIHDATVDRTTNGSGAVAALTLDEIRSLDAGSWYAPGFAGEPVPLFEEFLDVLVVADVPALVELKGEWSADEVASIMDGIYFRGVQNLIVFASFSPRTVTALRDAAPTIPRVLIRRVLPLDPVRVAKRYDAVALMTRASALQKSPDAVARMHDAGLGVLLYTLNSEQRWGEALAYGVDGIVTDKPSALDAWIAQTAPGT